MTERDFEAETQTPTTSVCLLDAGPFFWEAVLYDLDLSLLLETYDGGVCFDKVLNYIDVVNEVELDENDPEEREAWTMEIPESMQMAMESRVAQLLFTYEKQIAGKPAPDLIN